MRLVIRFLVLTLWLFLNKQAYAQLYVGVMGGQTDVTPYLDSDDLPEMIKDVGFRAYLGNRLSEKFSYEVAYVDFGSYEFEGRPTGTEDTLSITGFDVSILGRIPIRRRFLLFGRLGVFDWEGERRIVDTIAQTDFLVTSGKTNHHAGLGVELRFSKYLGVTVEANHYRAAELSNYLYGLGVFFTF